MKILAVLSKVLIVITLAALIFGAVACAAFGFWHPAIILGVALVATVTIHWAKPELGMWIATALVLSILVCVIGMMAITAASQVRY